MKLALVVTTCIILVAVPGAQARPPIVKHVQAKIEGHTVAWWRAKAVKNRRQVNQAALELRRAKARLATLKQQVRELQTARLPEPADWLTAVRVVQRVYPGTDGWLVSCSASEGGHGGFVMNSQGSGASGWMQFLPGTFTRMYWAAKADAEARGFRVPVSAAGIGSPLGQALAGAWGVTNGRRGEWYGAGC